MEIVLAGGCFWCTETIFKNLKGVSSVISGYSGGERENPNWDQIHLGNTGHAEAIKITFDPKVISLEDLLYVFFKTHDPTTLNRQGADVGSQYRSAIFYMDDNQKESAEKALKLAQKDYKVKIVTEITAYKNFYPAESYHQDFYANNKLNFYCRVVIDPKIRKLRQEFPEQVKEVKLSQ